MGNLILILFILAGYILPVAAVAQEFSLVMGAAALVLPLIVHYIKLQKKYKLILWAIWAVVAVVAEVMAVGWWTLLSIFLWRLYLWFNDYLTSKQLDEKRGSADELRVEGKSE